MFNIADWRNVPRHDTELDVKNLLNAINGTVRARHLSIAAQISDRTFGIFQKLS